MNASPEQIKARYKQLVRIYHPDRYANPTDRQFVEQKLKDLNEAYDALMQGTRSHAPRAQSNVLPQPIVLPPSGLDFGQVQQGVEQKLVFQVGNAGGAAEKFTLHYNEQVPWFQVTEGKRVYSDKPFPIEFVVGVNTHALEPGQRYSAWIDINMDEVVSRLPLSLQVVPPRAWPWFSPRLAAVCMMLLLLLASGLAPYLWPGLTQLAFSDPGSSAAALVLASSTPLQPTATISSENLSKASIIASNSITQDTTVMATNTISAPPSPTAAVPTSTATHAATPTNLPTRTPLPTFTPLPTDTPLPTNTALPTVTPTARPVNALIIVDPPNPPSGLAWAMVSAPLAYDVAVRAQPTTEAEIVAVLVAGAQVAGIGRTADNGWLQVLLPNGQPAWVATDVVFVDGDYLPGLPVVASQ